MITQRLGINYKVIISEIKKQVVNSVISEDIVMNLSNENNLSNMDFSLMCEELEHYNIVIVSDEEYKKALDNGKLVDDEVKAHSDNSHINDEITAITELFFKLSEDDKKNCLKKLFALVEQNILVQPTICHQEADFYVNSSTKKEFFTKLRTKSLQYSYIAVLIKALISKANLNGQAQLEDIIDYFWNFYNDRKQKGLVVEQEDSVFYKDNYTRVDIRKIILFNPVKRSFLANYVAFNKSTNMLVINSSFWTTLTTSNKKAIVEMADEKLTAYYNRISM